MRIIRPFFAGLAIAALLFGQVAQAQVAASYPALNFKNILGNPRFDIYPATTNVVYTSSSVALASSAINTTPSYHAARWAAYSNNASASVTVSNITANLPAGFANAEQIQRTSGNTNTTTICGAVQEIRSADVVALQGQPIVLSEWLIAGGTFSAASGNVSIQVAYGTGTDQGLASYLSGWTGAGTLTSTQAISSTWTRYAAAFTLPATATEALVQTCFTPVGTAGSGDYFQVTGAQLEIGTAPTPIENRLLTIENELFVYPYTQVITDGAATRRYGLGQALTTTTAQVVVPLLAPMRAVPTSTVAVAASFGVTVAAGTAGTCSTLAPVSTSNTVDTATLLCTTAATLAAGNATEFIGAGTFNIVLISADF